MTGRVFPPPTIMAVRNIAVFIGLRATTCFSCSLRQSFNVPPVFLPLAVFAPSALLG